MSVESLEKFVETILLFCELNPYLLYNNLCLFTKLHYLHFPTSLNNFGHILNIFIAFVIKLHFGYHWTPSWIICLWEQTPNYTRNLENYNMFSLRNSFWKPGSIANHLSQFTPIAVLSAWTLCGPPHDIIIPQDPLLNSSNA